MRGVVFASVSGAAILLTGYLWVSHQGGRTDPADTTPSRPDVHKERAAAQNESERLLVPREAPYHAANASFKATALPPANVKLANVYPELKRLADGGDAKAACRLAYELNRCRTLPILELIAKNYAKRLTLAKESGRLTPTDEERKSQIEAEYESATKVCSDFPSTYTAEAWRYAVEAAQAGNGSAIMNFVGLKMGLDERHPDNTAEGWIAYKELAPGLLQRALDMGMPDAYEYAASLYGWKNSPQQLVPYDPVRALAMYEALSNVATDEQYKTDLAGRIEALKQQYGFSPAEVTKADAESARMSAVISQNARGVIDGKPRADRGAICEK